MDCHPIQGVVVITPSHFMHAGYPVINQHPIQGGSSNTPSHFMLGIL